MEKRKIMASILCVAMVIGLFAGCGKSSSESGVSASSGASGDEAGVVRYTLTTTPQIDPGVGADLGAATVLINIYDPLVMPKKDGSVEPWIAKEWKVAEDGKTWTFTIRDDVKFHSGNPLTAKDVTYTMQRLLDMGEGFGYLFNTTVDSVKTVDDTTVEIVCKETTGTLLATLVRLYILDSKLVEENYADGNYGEKGDYGKAFLLEHDAGSGPYKVKEYAANSHVLCEQNTEYWQELVCCIVDI